MDAILHTSADTLPGASGGRPARRLARVALASYFAGAVLMPYGPFLEAARAERYDIELLGHRFRVGFEHDCQKVARVKP